MLPFFLRCYTLYEMKTVDSAWRKRREKNLQKLSGCAHVEENRKGGFQLIFKAVNVGHHHIIYKQLDWRTYKEVNFLKCTMYTLKRKWRRKLLWLWGLVNVEWTEHTYIPVQLSRSFISSYNPTKSTSDWLCAQVCMYVHIYVYIEDDFFHAENSHKPFTFFFFFFFLLRNTFKGENFR